MQWVCKKFQPVDCVHMLNREWTLYKRLWVTKSQATLESDCHSTNLFLSVNLWCKDLVPQKRGKGIAVSELNILATELSLFAEQRVDFVQENMGDLEPTHIGIRLSLNKISSLVLICDAKTWSHKKEEKELQWVIWMFWPLDCLYILNREWTL